MDRRDFIRATMIGIISCLVPASKQSPQERPMQVIDLQYRGDDWDYIGLSMSSSPNYADMAIRQLEPNMPFAVKLPCGEMLEIRAGSDVPLADTPCPCGAENHWLVRWHIDP